MRWIKIDETVPKRHERVLILIDGELEIATYVKDARIGGSEWHDGWGPIDEYWNITHWLPLDTIPLPYPRHDSE